VNKTCLLLWQTPLKSAPVGVEFGEPFEFLGGVMWPVVRGSRSTRTLRYAVAVSSG